MIEPVPAPYTSRWMVWTDHTAMSGSFGRSVNEACWFWSASGPRGHMSGAEGTSDRAIDRAWAAYQLLYGDQERDRNRKKDQVAE